MAAPGIARLPKAGTSHSHSKSPSSIQSKSASKGGGKSQKSMSWSKRLFSLKNAEPLPLPPDWKEYYDAASGNPYYANKKTGESSWDRPKPDPKQPVHLVKDSKSTKVKTTKSAKAGKSTKSGLPEPAADVEQSFDDFRELQKTVSFSEENLVHTYNVDSQPVSPARNSKKKPLVKTKKLKSSHTRASKFTRQSSQKEQKAKADKAGSNKSNAESSSEDASSRPFNLGWKRPATVSSPFKSEEAHKLAIVTPEKSEPIKREDTQVSFGESSDKSMPRSASKMSVPGMWKSTTTDIKLLPAEPRNEPKEPVVEAKVASLPTTPSRSTKKPKSSQPVVAALPVSPSKSTTAETEIPPIPQKSTSNTAKSSSLERNESVSEPLKASQAISQTPSMIASLMKTAPKEEKPKLQTTEPKRPVASSSKTWPGTLKLKKTDSNEKTANKSKGTSDQAVATKDVVETKSAPDVSENTKAPLRSPSVSDRFKAFTATLLGSEDFNRQEEDSLVPKSSIEKTPERSPITKKTEDGSPASSVIASSFPLAALVFPGAEEGQSAKPIERSPSKKGSSFFKKNRSNEDEAAPVVVGLDASSNDKSLTVGDVEEDSIKTEDNVEEGTIKTESSKGSINQVDLSGSGWVVDNDFDDIGEKGLSQEGRGCGDCGVSQSIHEHLICVGGCIYSLIGKPSDHTRMTMEEMGDFFAEEVSDDESECE